MNIPIWLDRYCTDSKLKYPSERTQENYQSSVKSFLYKFKDVKEPSRISTQDIKKWLCSFDTINTRNHKLCGIKSFYEITVGMPLKLDKIPFSKKDKKLPIVLSIYEVQSMFKVCDNLKHKVILALLYSCGLRVSELINLKWSHIDRSRMIINIIQAKGNKDRQVMLTPELLPLLEKYWHEYKPKEYILNGQFPNKQLQYSDRSVGEVVKQIALKAGINKRVYTHLMRHNCFTHMVENGTDIIKMSCKFMNILIHLLYEKMRNLHNNISLWKNLYWTIS